MRTSDPFSLIAADSAKLQKRRWREMHDLATRGMFQPESLSPSEISVISGVALLGIKEASAKADDPPSAQQRR